MNGLLDTLRVNGTHSVLKKIFIGYLSLVAGCANTTENLRRSTTVEQQHSSSQSSPAGATSGQSMDATSLEDVTRKINGLPTLDLEPGTAKAKKTVSPTFENGTFEPSELQPIASPTQSKTSDAKDMGAMLVGMANSSATDAVKDWFTAHRATAQINVAASQGGVKTGSFDLLVPLFDDKENDLIFTQLGVRRSNQFTEDARTTVNLGLGYRHQTENRWLLGANTFYDRDVTGKNDRLGMGVEAWTDNLKVAANGYLRLSDWKKSPDVYDYLERPANGWDVRAEAFLPSYPQLGGKLMYEQYYGDEVGLFGPSSHQKDPSAMTVGLTYAPIPLISVAADYRQGQNGMSDTSIRLGINYRIGESFKKQLSPDQIRINHMLQNARYDLVDRRNEIVMDHKKIEHGSIVLPPQIDGSASTLLTFPVSLLGPSISSLSWKGSAAPYALPYGGGPIASVKLPINATAAPIAYFLQAVGMDSEGKLIESNMMTINVEPVFIELKASKNTGIGDGTDNIEFTANLKKFNGAALADTEVVWGVEGQASVTEKDEKTNALGNAKLKLFSRFASNVRVTVSQVGGIQAQSDVVFMTNEENEKVSSVTTSSPSVLADGVSVVMLTATVLDSANKPAKAGLKVNWKTDVGSVSAATSLTDNSGKAVVAFKSLVTGTANIVASSAKGSSGIAIAMTSAVLPHIASMSVMPASIPADGVTPSTVIATVVDSKGIPVGSGVKVDWATDKGILSQSSTMTDAQGKATVTVHGSDVGNASVTATAPNGAQSAIVGFTAVLFSKVAALAASPNIIPADGTTKSTLTATVHDANGLPVVAGTPVAWVTTAGTLSAATSLTNSSGVASVSIVSLVDATATITASAANGSSTIGVTFTEASTAKVASVTASPAVIPADGASLTTIKAVVHDDQGNPVAGGVSVAWTASAGSLSAASSLTDASGVASITLSSAVSGSATVTANALKGGASTVVTLTYVSTAKVSAVSATPSQLQADNATVTKLMATVLDAQGLPVPAGELVTWTASIGSLSASTSLTDASGKATVDLKSSIAGNSIVTASALKGASTTAVNFTVDGTNAYVMFMGSQKWSIQSNGIDSTQISAVVFGSDGSRVGAGVLVTWTSIGGNLGQATSLTNSAGTAKNTVTTTSNASFTVTASAPKGSKTEQIDIAADLTNASINLSIAQASIPKGNPGGAQLTATVSDSTGADLEDAEVSWTTSGPGYFDETVSYVWMGQVTNSFYPTNVGTYTITATIGNKTSSVNLTVTKDFNTAGVTSVMSSKTSIMADGVESTTFTATVEDGTHNPIGEGATVNWTTTLGTLSSATSITDASSQASITLTSSSAGVATVKGKAKTNVTATGSVTVLADYSKARITRIMPSTQSVPADGTSTQYINFHIDDANNNNFVGVPVTYSVSGGVLASGSQLVSDTFGDVQARVTSTSANTDVVVTANIAADSKSGVVRFTKNPHIDAISANTTIPASLGYENDKGAPITVTVTDDDGNPLAGFYVSTSTTFGTLYSNGNPTDANGQVTYSFKSGSQGTGTAIFRVGNSGPKSVTIDFKDMSVKVSYISMNANSGSMSGGGILPIIYVEDSSGNYVDGVQIEYSCVGSFCVDDSGNPIISGASSPNATMTGITGQEGTGYFRFGTISPNMPGTATFKARVVDARYPADSGITASFTYIDDVN
jgi:adhesin/invasin